MLYHVVIHTVSGQRQVRLGLDESELMERFLNPYGLGQPIVIGGRTVPMADLSRIQITQTDADVPELARVARRSHEQRLEEGVIDFAYNEDEAIAMLGDDVTDRFITSPPGSYTQTTETLPTGEPSSAPVDSSRVFVVHGRNSRARYAMFAFLRSLGLRPVEWSEARQSTGMPSPYIGQILDAAFGMAAAVVVLMTPDDLAYLREDLRRPADPLHETNPSGQARPNVLFEAGMAMGRDESRTILVELGRLRPFSDLGGRHVVRLTDATQDRQELANRLLSAGADVSMIGTDWHTAGEFDSSLTPTNDVAAE